ncbi:DUF1292 domain-containing protein [Pseudalkalibacillus caeni]|uniref:UPF0473 protein FCL54_03060 n=1 Tax=Exobacillus caeni TaxID=2574798 RepID=A0A5R9FCA9_9BACL|nr:DUF1292 domain-containing protein [Pseudalkalibacillus caeni]TLS39298.1 DUF1292 domain-containing protein [Pseudalkalibacillus caeni]
MSKEERERIIIPDENGEEHLFEVLFTFDVDTTGNSYMAVIPVDSETDEEEEVEVFAFRFEEKGEKDDDLELYPIESDEEWEMVEEMLNTFSENEDEE